MIDKDSLRRAVLFLMTLGFSIGMYPPYNSPFAIIFVGFLVVVGIIGFIKLR